MGKPPTMLQQMARQANWLKANLRGALSTLTKENVCGVTDHKTRRWYVVYIPEEMRTELSIAAYHVKKVIDEWDVHYEKMKEQVKAIEEKESRK